MTKIVFVNLLDYVEIIFCFLALFFMARNRVFSKFRFVAAFLSVRLLTDLTFWAFTAFQSANYKLAYRIYYSVFWVDYVLESAVTLLIIYSIYRLAMQPLRGLQRLGNMMFRWAAGVAIAVSLAIGLQHHGTATDNMARGIAQFQQTISVLTLCMLLFVTLAIRPMGLTTRSRIFGVSLGLGVIGCTNLVMAAWLTTGYALDSSIQILSGLAGIFSMLIWVVYFALPEPKRTMILLPTTSPFLRWNQISMALGDHPGYVAVGEVGLDMFAPAEVEIMRRASLMMRSPTRRSHESELAEEQPMALARSAGFSGTSDESLVIPFLPVR